MSSVLAIGATNFCDDFTVLEVEPLTASACETIEAFFNLLGWSLKELPPFDVRAEPLGALVDSSDAEFVIIRVGNRSRAVEVSEMIDTFVASDMTCRRILEKLRGRIVFARSLCFGRFAGCALRTLNRHCSFPVVTSVRKASHADDEELRDVLSHCYRVPSGNHLRVKSR